MALLVHKQGKSIVKPLKTQIKQNDCQSPYLLTQNKSHQFLSFSFNNILVGCISFVSTNAASSLLMTEYLLQCIFDKLLDF